MKVLDLFCRRDHAFEGWFASEDDFQNQLARGLVQCPMCGDAGVRKGLSAPRLNLGARGADAPAPQPGSGQEPAAAPIATTAPVASMQQAAWLQLARQIMQRTEDVGERFAQEARRMHYGEAEERGIRGQATAQQTMELLEEGIAVLPLPLPDAAKETLQ
jgi:hypothetical protein